VVLKLVKNVREDEPRVGGRKLHHRILPKLKKAKIKCGRDRLFATLRAADMLVKPKKSFQKTTYSQHQYAVAPNRIKELEIGAANQVLVSDITYLRLAGNRFAYLFLVTDAFSRKILGYHVSRDLTHHSALLALDSAVAKMKSSDGVIHHSDRGCQYCCHEFLNYLREHEMYSSMTDESHCYQNAIAERVNGILKDEFNLDAVFDTFATLQLSVARAVFVYNTKRTHWSLNLKTPEKVYAEAA
jgi:transposase InsO family protein